MEHAAPARFLSAHENTAAVPQPLALLPAPAPPDASAACLRAQLPPPRAGLRVCVIVPARNEADNLPATLAALAAQRGPHGQPLPADHFEVLLLANNCTDDTAARGRQLARQYPALALHVAELHLEADHAHVGRARRLLMDEAAARFEQLGRPAGIIASTDADTQVAPDWLAATQAEIAAGADAVGGRILTDAETAVPPGSPTLAQLRHTQQRDTDYRLLCAQLEHQLDPAPADPWPRHHQHFGASLALTARAYRQVGGLPEVRYLEDEALCQRLRRHDLAIRHSPRVRVVTSARCEGRVEVGLSWQLREWQLLNQQQREPLVDNPVQLAQQWQLRRQLRAWRAGQPGAETEALVTRLALPAAVVLAQVQQALTFGELWEWALQNSPSLGLHQVPLSEALAVLPLLLNSVEPTP